MQKDIVQEVLNHPKYADYVKRRTRMSTGFFVVALAIYSGFILTLAYWPSLFARPIVEGWAMSIGIVTGVAVVCSAVVMIAIYTYYSNKIFDPLLAEIIKDVE